jgi:nucleoside-diphosphate-sugar epimerase
MRALVTGGAGFIGSNLVRRLLERGDEVRVIDNFSTGHRGALADVADDVEVLEGDIRSYERAATAVRDVEVVFHQAALPSVPRSVQDPLTVNDTNVGGTLNVLLSARDAGARRVVFASSSSIYGANPELPKREEMRPVPISPYAVSKLAGEQYCRSFHRVYGLESVALRYFNVFGPYQDPTSYYAAVIPKFVLAIMRGDRPVVFGDGTQSRDFTFVDNAVSANLSAATAEAASGVYNVAAGERVSLNELLQAMAEYMEVDVEAEYAEPRPGDVLHSLASVDLAREELGYEPEVRWLDGLRRTIDWYADRSTPVPAPS